MTNRISLQQALAEELKDQVFAEHYEKERVINVLAKNIAKLRLSANMTQAELAAKIGTRQSVISRLESGRDVRMPSLDLLARIALATGNRLSIQFLH